VWFHGADGLSLAADEWGDPTDPSVLLLHGGGQTRHSWKTAGTVLARAGFHCVAMDLRGHGESDWASDGRYSLEAFRDDVLVVAHQLRPPVTLVGASLGGLTSLLVTQAAPGMVRALVLVDIVPKMEPAGTGRILDFMRGSPHGFASLDEAAEAVAAYLPHRKRPRSVAGLRKNLREHADGRWYWHWDPALAHSMLGREPGEAAEMLDGAARSVQCPTLLLHGRRSDVVSEAGVEHLRGLLAHVEVVRLDDAAHTAAADDNDAFAAAVAQFCQRV
jgi:pimeloyl-ACP methyl ester carboxylesterase